MKLEKYSKPILRIGISLIFLYFGFMQILSPEEWIGFVPSFALVFGITAKNLVIANALIELVLGAFMIIGLYTRISSFVLSLNLFAIAFSIGFNPIGVRDFGLAVAAFAVFLNGPDRLCIDRRHKEEK